jgi:hypothetical protein
LSDAEIDKVISEYDEIFKLKFWEKMFSPKESPLIRRAAYNLFVVAVTKRKGWLFSSHGLWESDAVVPAPALPKLSLLMFGLLTENESSVHQEMWGALLSFIKGMQKTDFGLSMKLFPVVGKM